MLAINTYNGWGTQDRLTDLSASEWRVPADRPLEGLPYAAPAESGFPKGLISETGQRKQAFDVPAAYHASKAPVTR